MSRILSEHTKKLNRERKAKWRLANPARNKAHLLKWRKNHPEYDQNRHENHYENIILQRAKTRAKNKKIEFTITKSDILPLPTHCPVLGIELDYSFGTKNGTPNNNSPSIDRINSSKGYTPGNVCIMSWRANSLKKDATIQEINLLSKFLTSFSSQFLV